MTTNPVNRFTYQGICVGGPWAQRRLVSQGDPVYRLARMKPFKVQPGYYLTTEPWVEQDQGQYEWDSGIWWWRGWE